MAITKLQALAQGTVGNSTGTEIADTVNAVIDSIALDRVTHPVTKDDNEAKLIQRVSANELVVYTQKNSKGYARIQLKNNVTVTDESLATTTSDITSFRAVGVTNCVDVCVGYVAESASTGTWSNPNLISGIEEDFNAGIEYKYKQAQGAASYTVEIEVPSTGYFNLGFLQSNSSTTSLTIKVDGNLIDTISLQNTTAQLFIVEYRATPGTRSIEIESTIAVKYINFLGANFFKLKDAKSGLSYDNSGYYRHSTNYDDYVLGNSANNYAIRAYDNWGGSYHGGETGITTTLLLDGNELTLANGDIAVGSKLKIVQDFNIDWTSVGGVVLQGHSEYSYFAGGYNTAVSFTGSIVAESYFTSLYGMKQDFNLITAPQNFDISTLADEARLLLGKNNAVTYANDKNQSLSITHTLSTNEEIEDLKGNGAYIYKVDGSYNKYYYGFSDRQDKELTSSYAVNVIQIS